METSWTDNSNKISKGCSQYDFKNCKDFVKGTASNKIFDYSYENDLFELTCKNCNTGYSEILSQPYTSATNSLLGTICVRAGSFDKSCTTLTLVAGTTSEYTCSCTGAGAHLLNFVTSFSQTFTQGCATSSMVNWDENCELWVYDSTIDNSYCSKCKNSPASTLIKVASSDANKYFYTCSTATLPTGCAINGYFKATKPTATNVPDCIICKSDYEFIITTIGSTILGQSANTGFCAPKGRWII